MQSPRFAWIKSSKEKDWKGDCRKYFCEGSEAWLTTWRGREGDASALRNVAAGKRRSECKTTYRVYQHREQVNRSRQGQRVGCGPFERNRGAGRRGTGGEIGSAGQTDSAICTPIGRIPTNAAYREACHQGSGGREGGRFPIAKTGERLTSNRRIGLARLIGVVDHEPRHQPKFSRMLRLPCQRGQREVHERS